MAGSTGIGLDDGLKHEVHAAFVESGDYAARDCNVAPARFVDFAFEGHKTVGLIEARLLECVERMTSRPATPFALLQASRRRRWRPLR